MPDLFLAKLKPGWFNPKEKAASATTRWAAGRAVGRDVCLAHVPGGLAVGLPLPVGSSGVGISVPGGEVGGRSTGLFHRCLTSVNQEAVTQVMGWV